MMRRLLWAGAFLLILWWFWPAPTPVYEALDGAVRQAPTFNHQLSVDGPPLQQALDDSPGPFSAGEFLIEPVANFEIEARVLGRKRYRSGVEAELSPLDVAFGWGPMARPEVLKKIRISQSGRFYRWRVDEFPIPRRDIEQHSANMHLIPASAGIADQIDQIDPDQFVRLGGYLVNVDRADGWRWRTSLTRSDTGAGACEIVLVTRVQPLPDGGRGN
ncbi:MAG: hypothetical protein HND55_09120 [Pseudomonadota bacterium]|nr:MAG: hypothetical protein HND55_09120 [Pseudomonadota bacterium]